MTKRIIITVLGGLADVAEYPDGIEIEIRDYDTEGLDGVELIEGEDGERYHLMYWPSKEGLNQ